MDKNKTMKPIGKKIMVEAYLAQKESISVTRDNGDIVKLWMAKSYTTNHRERNPVVAKVLSKTSPDFPYIKEGDIILVHHNFLSEWRTNPFCIEYSVETGIGVYSIPLDRNVFCKINEDGSVSALCHNIIAERLKNPVKTKLILIPETVKQEHEDRVKVKDVAPDVEGISPGQTVLIMKKADYEICYNWGGREHSVIKVFDEEIIGILN